MVPIWMLHTPALSILPGLYATVSKIDLATIGGILVASRILDAVTDPLIGMLSDRTRSAIGKRKPWLIAGSMLCALGCWFWFRPAPDTGAAYFMIWSIVVYLGWTMVEIPHSAWLSELAEGYDERSYLSGFRTAGTLLGYVLFWSGPFLPLFATTEITPELMAFLSLVIIVLIVLTVSWTVVAVPQGHVRAPAAPDLKAALGSLAANKPLRVYAAIVLAGWLASGMVSGLYFFFITSYLQIPGKFGHVGLTVAVIGFASASLWGWIGARIGKHRMLAICNLSTVLTLIAMAFIRPGPAAFHALLTIFALAALFNAGSSVALYALMADIVDYDTWKTGAHNAGNYYALISLLQKFGLGAGAGLGLVISAAFGFDATAKNEGLALTGFFVAFIAIPIVLNLIATSLAAVFPITRRRHDVIRRRLDRREQRLAGAAHG